MYRLVMTYNLVCSAFPNPKAYITNNDQDGITLGEVKWRGRGTLVKLVSLDDGIQLTTTKTGTCPPELYALFKSNLQKQVRQGKRGAIASACLLWDLCPFEYLRRLVIIAAEDVELFSELAVVTWLMAASTKGLVLTNVHRDWTLGLVEKLIEISRALRLERKHAGDWFKLNNDLSLEQVLASEHPQRGILGAILFRMAYGGLTGDPPMLSRCVDYYLSNKKLMPELETIFKPVIPKLLINPAAIDHHIYVSLPAKIAGQCKYSEDFIRTVIWECSSSKNWRCQRVTKNEWMLAWKEIKPIFKKLALEYLRNLCAKYPNVF